MKPNVNMLFGNIFDDEKMIPTYIERFADDVLAKLIQNNGTAEYTSVLNPLQASILPFRLELGQVDTSLNVQVGNTATVDGFIVSFKAYMKNNYIDIAIALGNEKTPAFIEFYPKGKTEYAQLTKTKIPTIMERLKTAALKNQSAIGATTST